MKDSKEKKKEESMIDKSEQIKRYSFGNTTKIITYKKPCFL